MPPIRQAKVRAILVQPYRVRVFLSRLPEVQAQYVQTAAANLPVEAHGASLSSVAARLPGDFSEAQLTGGNADIFGSEC